MENEWNVVRESAGFLEVVLAGIVVCFYELVDDGLALRNRC